MPQFQAPLNPVDIEQNIRTLSSRIAKGVGVVDEAYRAFLDSDRLFEAAYARAYLSADGPVEDRKQAARVKTMGEREARDVAEAAFKYADRRAKALELELRALQSIGASVRSMYAVAGRGE